MGPGSDDRDGRTNDGWQRGAQSRSRGSSMSRQRGGSLPVGAPRSGPRRLIHIATPWPIWRPKRDSRRAPSAITLRRVFPAARGRGVGATYSPTHLLRLKAIGLLKKDNTPLEQIRQRLHDMRDTELAAMLEVETAPPEDRWRRVMLHPDLELHVRERGGRNRDYTFEQVVDLIVKQSEILINQQLRDAD